MKSDVKQAIVIIIITCSMLSACKKGKDDPFLSLRSRKARIIGTWDVSNYIKSDTSESVYSFDNDTRIRHNIIEHHGNDFSMSWRSYNLLTDLEYADYTFKLNGVTENFTYTFNENGTFASIKTYRYRKIEEEEENFRYFVHRKVTEEYKGTWSFLKGKGYDFKDKERIMLDLSAVTASYTDTLYLIDLNVNEAIDSVYYNNTYTDEFASGTNTEVWQLTELRNKEMNAFASLKNVLNSTNISMFNDSTEYVKTSRGSLLINLNKK